MEYVADTFNKELKKENDITKNQEEYEPKDPNYPMGQFDGLKWAEEFVKIHGKSKITVDLMLAWFSCAIMTGYDHKKSLTGQKKEEYYKKGLYCGYNIGLDVGNSVGYIDGHIDGYNSALSAFEKHDIEKKEKKSHQEEIHDGNTFTNYGTISKDYNI